ncbi:MAG: hypothetical protein K2N38_04755 [Oscillospiraceae bacterium]|nr:hypothetical protein [Oscillospiraceae bacterium]
MKRICALIIAAVLTLCTGCSSDKRSVSDEAFEARTALYTEFTEDQMVVFPDNYAGCYFDDAGKKLVVNIVGDTSEYEFLRENYKCVELRQVEKTLSELEDMVEQLEGEVKEAFPELDYVRGEANEELNCVTIRLDDSVIDDAELMEKLNAKFDGYPLVFKGYHVVHLL